jgi:hypothetical protein
MSKHHYDKNNSYSFTQYNFLLWFYILEMNLCVLYFILFKAFSCTVVLKQVDYKYLTCNAEGGRINEAILC